MNGRSLSTSRRRAILGMSLALSISLPVTLVGAEVDRQPSRLENPEIIRLPSVDPTHLAGEPDEMVRVGFVLAEQPVLEKTTKPGFEDALSGYTRGDLQAAARESPVAVSELEEQAGRSAERRRNVVGRDLEDEVARLEAEEHDLAVRIERRGAELIERAQSGPLAMVIARVGLGDIKALAARRDVQAVIAQPRLEPELNTSTTTIGASSVWDEHSGGGDDDFGGASDVRTGIEVGMAGDTPQPTHPAFVGIDVNNGGSTAGAHGTATAGVVASRDTTYRGVAPGISGLRGGAADDWSTTSVDTRSESFGNFANGNDGVGDVADLAAHSFLVPWAASAGNRNDEPGVTPGTSTTGGDGMGRNILSVGAFGDNSTTTDTDNAIAGFSSFGPSPGRRKEPELTAPGVAITGPGIGGGVDTNSGTSLAAPHVGGALAILVGAGMTDPRAMRAVLVNSAQPWCNGHNDTPPAGTSLLTAYPSGTCQDRWMPDVGWGELDVPGALDERGNAVVGEVEGGSVRFYRATADPGEKATLAWNMRGVLGPDVTQHVYFTVTNLDLRQYRPDETEILPAGDPGWGAGPDAIDPNDTTEQVRAPSPGGDVVYKVEAASDVEGAPTERFGLASANPLTPLDNPGVNPVDVAHSPSGCDQNVHITASAENPSDDLEAGTSTLSLELPAGVELVVGPQTHQVSGGTLETRSTSEPVSWTIRPTSSGNHQVKIRGEGRAYGTTFTDRETITVGADCAPPPDPGPDDPPPPATVPQVAPHSLEVTPAGGTQCGQQRTLSAGFRNPTSTDAPDARGDLRLSNSARLLGAGEHQVSGGVLEAGALSEVHSWQFREAREETTATVTGSTYYGGQVRASQARLTVTCTMTKTVMTGEARLRKERLNAEGKLRFDGPRTVSIAGERVSVAFERPAKDGDAQRRGGNRRKDIVEERARLDAAGSFDASIRACRQGRYKVRATFRGSPGYEPARRQTLGTVRAKGC